MNASDYIDRGDYLRDPDGRVIGKPYAVIDDERIVVDSYKIAKWADALIDKALAEARDERKAVEEDRDELLRELHEWRHEQPNQAYKRGLTDAAQAIAALMGVK